MKSKKLLNNFINFCESYPEKPFWQALSEWSGSRYIYIKNKHCICGGIDVREFDKNNNRVDDIN